MLADKGSHKTSAVVMIEIATSQLKSVSPLDHLQVPAQQPAPLSAGKSQVKSHTIAGTSAPHNGKMPTFAATHSFGTGTSTPTVADGKHTWIVHTALRRNAGPYSGSAVEHTNLVKTKPPHGSICHNLFECGEELLSELQEKVEHGSVIAETLRRGSHIVISHLPPGKARQVFKTVRVVLRRSERYLEKTSDKLETLGQLVTLAHNVTVSLPQMSHIIGSDEQWSIKAAKIGTEFTALSARSIAQIALEPVHAGLKVVRTGAAMAGMDITHPTFGSRSVADPRTWVSWQAINFFETRLNYLTQTVYDGETLYVFLHSSFGG